MRFYVNAILFAVLSLVVTTTAAAQITLNNMPAWTGNSRFYNDVIAEVKHPSLTLNGFDSGTSGHGLGLRQVLEQAYNGSSGGPVVEVYDEIKDLAADNGNFHPTPSNQQGKGRAQIIENTQRMQARAFMALVTYVMERNGEGDELESLPDNIETPDKAADRLRSALTNTDAWRIVKSWKDDGVKWSTVLENMARTIDLYLALENAYCYYGNQGHTPSQEECSGTTTDRLLSKNEKHDVFAHFGEQIKTLEDSKNWGYSVLPTNRYNAEPGNASLKIQTGIGYASLTHQTVNPIIGLNPWIAQDHVLRALKANLRSAGDNRRRYWGYQTDDGKRFWAEGPFYLRFALKDVLPFWHAVRINGMLDYHPDFTAPDPFDHPRFTEPLHWLADVVTPGGKTPPLDDGKKRELRVSMLLRWTGEYGEAALGEKFAWIADKFGFGARANLLTVEIAIPRVGGNGTAPASAIGNTSANQTGENGEQQIVLRRSTSSNACKDANTGSSGDCHYLLLNGESGDAYRRGEGHEQPDQMQLLYYIDGTSILMDSGYDNASFSFVEALKGEYNSTWNNYYDHNVLHGIGASGGLPDPVITANELRKKIDPQNPGYLYRTQHGNVDLLRGKQYLPETIVLQDGTQAAANYKRDVLFVNGSDPYLIDFSRVKHWASWTNFANLERQFKLSYHVNSTSVALNNFAPDNGQFITWSGVGGSGKNAYVYPLGIEYWVKVRQSNSDIVDKTDTAKEENGPAVNLKRVDIKNFDVNTHPQHFSVATIIQARGQTPPNAPKMLWGGFSQNHQGWVWKQGAETYDVFIGRESKTSASSAVRVNLQNADNQYPDYRIELPSGKRYGFARVHKSGGEWSINSNYQVNLDLAPPPPLDVSITSGPTVLDEGEQGTWTASASKSGASYTWSADEGYGWSQIGTGSSVNYSKDYISSTITVDIKVEAVKGSETASAQTSVIINNNDGGGGCNAPGGNQICLAVDGNPFLLRDVRAEVQKNSTAYVSWRADGLDVPSKFVVQHRADSTAAWSTLGTVPASDSSSVHSSQAAAYRFRTDKLDIGTHQFRVGLPQGMEGSGPRAVGTNAAGSPQRFTGPVAAKIKMDEAYRLSTYPNPASEQATVELAVQERQEVSVRLYDVLGRRVATLHDGPLPAQELRRLRLDVPATGLTSGTYFLRVRGEDFAATEQITVVR